MARPNMDLDPKRAGEIIVFLVDPNHQGMSNHEAARRLNVHESCIRRAKEIFQWGLWANLDISSIRLDGGTQIRVDLDDSYVNEYMEAYKSGLMLPPPVVFYDGTNYWCADGHQRLEAARRAGKRKIECDLRSGTKRDAILFACGCNERHGKRRTAADRKNAILTALQDPEFKANNNNEEIAKVCKVSESLVRYYRSGPNKAPAICGCSGETAESTKGDPERERVIQKSANGKPYPRRKPSGLRKNKAIPNSNGTAPINPSPAPTDGVSTGDRKSQPDSSPEPSSVVSTETVGTSTGDSAGQGTESDLRGMKVCPCCGGSGQVPEDWSPPSDSLSNGISS